MRFRYTREGGWDIHLDLLDLDPMETYLLLLFVVLPAFFLCGLLGWFAYKLLGGS